MSAYIRVLIDFLLARIRVQDIPASQQLLHFSAIAALLADTLSGMVLGKPMSALVLALVQLLALLGFLMLLLRLNQKPERWLQSAIALLGARAITTLISIPFAFGVEVGELGLTLNPALLGVAGLQLWFLVIMVRVIKEALESSTGVAIFLGVLMNFAIFWVVLTVASLWAPEITPAAG